MAFSLWVNFSVEEKLICLAKDTVDKRRRINTTACLKLIENSEPSAELNGTDIHASSRRDPSFQSHNSVLTSLYLTGQLSTVPFSRAWIVSASE